MSDIYCDTCIHMSDNRHYTLGCDITSWLSVTLSVKRLKHPRHKIVQNQNKCQLFHRTGVEVNSFIAEVSRTAIHRLVCDFRLEFAILAGSCGWGPTSPGHHVIAGWIPLHDLLHHKVVQTCINMKAFINFKYRYKIWEQYFLPSIRPYYCEVECIFISKLHLYTCVYTFGIIMIITHRKIKWCKNRRNWIAIGCCLLTIVKIHGTVNWMRKWDQTQWWPPLNTPILPHNIILMYT